MKTLFLLLAGASMVVAQPKPTAVKSAPAGSLGSTLPDAKTILERSAAAAGGSDARKSIQTEKLAGKMSIAESGITGSMVIYRSQRGESYQVIEMPGAGKTEIANNGDIEWERSTLTGPKVRRLAPTPGSLLEPDPTSNLALSEKYSKIETAGLDKVHGRPCFLVRQSPKSGGPMQTVCYDRETFLPVKFEMALGSMPLKIILGDYRPVGTTKMPFLLETETMGQVIRVEFETITLNDPLPPEATEIPEEIENLAYHQRTEVRDIETDKDRPILRRRSMPPTKKK